MGARQVRTVDASDIADDVMTLEICHRQVAHPCPTLLRDRARNPIDRWPTWDATARLYRLRNVVLDRTHMVLLHDGRVVTQTNYLQAPEALAALRVDPDTVVRVPPGPAAAICFDHWAGNFYHWTAHTLPALYAIVERHPLGDVRLVLPALQPWQLESLDLVGAGRLPAITAEVGRQYLFADLAFLDITAGSLDFAISPLSRAAYAKVGASVPVTDGLCAKIYIDRGSAASRRLPNEAALAGRLRARGFAIVRPDRLAFSAQVALFRQARMVVGLHGAGLANIAWCRPETVVYEIIGSHTLNPCYMVMAQQGGLTYWADMFDSGVAGSDHAAGWQRELDIDLVLHRVEELESFVKP